MFCVKIVSKLGAFTLVLPLFTDVAHINSFLHLLICAGKGDSRRRAGSLVEGDEEQNTVLQEHKSLLAKAEAERNLLGKKDTVCN